MTNNHNSKARVALASAYYGHSDFDSIQPTSNPGSCHAFQLVYDLLRCHTKDSGIAGTAIDLDN